MTSHSEVPRGFSESNWILRVRDSIRGWPIGVHLLLAVNVPLGMLLTVLLVFEYQNRMGHALSEKQASLADEAVAVHQAILHIRQHHPATAGDSTADFIEQVCQKMQESRSPGHAIIVGVKGELFHSHGHGQLPAGADSDLLRAFRAGRTGLRWRNEAVAFGGYEEKGTTVVIAELATQMRRRARSETLWHLGGLIGLTVLAITIMDAVLWRLIRKPIRLMALSVDAVAQGELGVQLPSPVGRELQRLTRAFNIMSESLAVNEDQRQQQMAQAREIQEHLLPGNILVPGLKISCLFQPAEEVAGDYYDLIPLPNGTWMLVVADVAGHGVPAAMAATILKSVLLGAARFHQTPLAILQQVNQQFTSLLPCGRFATLLLAVWCPDTRRLTCVNAGHPSGLIWNPHREFRELPATTLPIGVTLEAPSPESHQIELASDDRLIWFTDGLIEAFSAEGQMFGIDRLRAAIINSEADHPEGLKLSILEALKRFVGEQRYADDLTLFVAGCCSNASTQGNSSESIRSFS